MKVLLRISCNFRDIHAWMKRMRSVAGVPQLQGLLLFQKNDVTGIHQTRCV